jgi:hypothetical protein
MIDELRETAKFIFGFLAWIVFLLLPTNGWEPLRRAVVVSLIISVVFSWKQLRDGFILAWATAGFFLLCTISFYGFEWIWLADHMAIVANSFLDGIIWFTVLIGKPFTLQYARADLPADQWYDENLVRSCRAIAIFWGLLLPIPIAFNVFQLLYPTALPGAFYFSISVFCIMLGILVTRIYTRLKRKQRAQTL